MVRESGALRLASRQELSSDAGGARERYDGIRVTPRAAETTMAKGLGVDGVNERLGGAGVTES